MPSSFLAMSLVLLSNLNLFVAASPLSNIGDVRWTGQVIADGDVRTFYGRSYHDIEAKIAAEYTNFTWATAPNQTELKKSGNQPNDEPVKCNTLPTGWAPAPIKYIKEGISYLRSLPGHCGSHPSYCGRMSCSEDSGRKMEIGQVRWEKS